MNIYVGNLPYKIRDEELRDAFEDFGEVLSAEVIMDRRSNRSKGYGFVKMGSEDDAFDAIDTMHRSDFHGRELRVQPANSDEKSKYQNRKSRDRDSSRNSRRSYGKSSGILGFLKGLLGR